MAGVARTMREIRHLAAPRALNPAPQEITVQIRVGYELTHDLPEETPMLLTPHVHPARASDLIVPDHLATDPSVAVSGYRDRFGDWISRILTPAGRIRLFPGATVRDSGEPGWEAVTARPIACPISPG